MGEILVIEGVGFETVKQFAGLFAGRSDAYGTDAGSCRREPVTLQLFANHLNGRMPIGIYPMRPAGADWIVKWGCVDIDFQDHQLAKNLAGVLEASGVPCFVERSRSKGFHVWVFAYTWLRARTMREALLAACQVIGYDPKEVNPKSDGEAQGPAFLGNYVRLPYPGFGAMGKQVMLIGDSPMTYLQFLSTAKDGRASLPAIAELARLYVPAAPKATVHIEQYDGELEDLRRRLSGLANTIFLEGPSEGSDRSSTLARFVAKTKDSGLTAGECLVLLRDADRRWGKYAGRTDAEQQYASLIQWGYG